MNLPAIQNKMTNLGLIKIQNWDKLSGRFVGTNNTIYNISVPLFNYEREEIDGIIKTVRDTYYANITLSDNWIKKGLVKAYSTFRPDVIYLKLIMERVHWKEEPIMKLNISIFAPYSPQRLIDIDSTIELDKIKNFSSFRDSIKDLLEILENHIEQNEKYKVQLKQLYPNAF